MVLEFEVIVVNDVPIILHSTGIENLRISRTLQLDRVMM